jgi:hypothetical protein
MRAFQGVFIQRQTFKRIFEAAALILGHGAPDPVNQALGCGQEST